MTGHALRVGTRKFRTPLSRPGEGAGVRVGILRTGRRGGADAGESSRPYNLVHFPHPGLLPEGEGGSIFEQMIELSFRLSRGDL
jgi:hypothetical protein